MSKKIIIYMPTDKHSTSTGADSFSVNMVLLLNAQELGSRKDAKSNLWHTNNVSTINGHLANHCSPDSHKKGLSKLNT